MVFGAKPDNISFHQQFHFLSISCFFAFFFFVFLFFMNFLFIFAPVIVRISGFPFESSFSASFKMATNSPETNKRRESPLPTVNERLGHLKPSRELLEYYRRKIAEYDGEYEEMVRKLELYKCTYEEQVK